MKCPTKSYYLKSGRNFRQKELQYFEFQKEKFRKAKIIILLQKENQYNRKAFFPETKFYSELYLNPDMSTIWEHLQEGRTWTFFPNDLEYSKVFCSFIKCVVVFSKISRQVINYFLLGKSCSKTVDLITCSKRPYISAHDQP